MASRNVHVFWNRAIHQPHCGYLLQHSSPWVELGHPSSLCSPPLSVGESLLWCLEHPLLSSFSDLDIFTVVSPFFYPHHTTLCLAFLPFLKCVYGGTTHLADGLSCALQQMSCGASWTQLCLAQGSLWSHRDYSVAHLLPKHCHPHPMQVRVPSPNF